MIVPPEQPAKCRKSIQPQYPIVLIELQMQIHGVHPFDPNTRHELQPMVIEIRKV